MKYRKRPVVVDAMILDKEPAKLVEWLGESAGRMWCLSSGVIELEIKTLEDGSEGQVKHIATEGDYIIKGIHGEFYPCKPDIFLKTYEEL